MSCQRLHPCKRRKTEEGIKDCDQPSTSKGPDDWRINNKTIKDRYSFALMNSYLKDVTFAVGPKKTQFHAHKLILSLASPVFEAMFYGSLKETNDVIEITDVTPDGFKLLLSFIYSEELNLANENDAYSAWFAAEKYCLPSMKDMCYKYLSKVELNHVNVWIMLEHSLFLDSVFLVNKCFNYLKKNISEAITSYNFLEVNSLTIQKILQIPSLIINEISLLRRIVVWAKEKVKNGGEQSLQELLNPLLQHIQFGSISQKEFVDFISENPDIIKLGDCLAILKFMTDDKKYVLPDWCARTVFSRKLCAAWNEKQMGQNKKIIRSYAVAVKPPRSSELSNSEIQDHPDNEIYYDYHPAAESPTRSDDNISIQTLSSTSSDSDEYARAVPRYSYYCTSTESSSDSS